MSLLQRLFGKSSNVEALPANGSHASMLAAASQSWAEEFAQQSNTGRERRMVSLVALSQSWAQYSVEEILQQLESLFPDTFIPAKSQSNWVSEGMSGKGSFAIQCMVDGYAGFYIVNSVPGPYSAFSDFLAAVEDPEVKRLASEQSCWFSIDSVRAYATDADAYRFIALLLSVIAPSDSSILVHPARGIARKFTPEVWRQLAAGDNVYGLA